MAGVILGLIFYGGLWWTVCRLPRVSHPALWMLASFVLRIGVAVAGLALLTAGDWRRLVAAVLGFLLVRLVLVRTMGDDHAIQS